ncbi:MAG: YbaB/EbfC family nucleoid-associated protein [Candidatus Kapaibacteriales bacterium]
MNIADMIGKVRSMQDDMKKMREQLEKREISSESGAGMVKCVMTGDNKLVSLDIDDSLLSDKKMLQDLVIAAVNAGQEKVQDTVSEEMKSLSGGLPNIPGMDLFR